MAPKTAFEKIRAAKKPKSILDEDPKFKEKGDVIYSSPAVTEIPPVTDEERERWAQIRAREEWVNGVPKEGWRARIEAMKADGRLYVANNTMHWRGR
jgi:hypothetical protein